jgi:hypothetical protein
MGLLIAKMYTNTMDPYDEIAIDCYNTNYSLRKIPGAYLDLNNKHGLHFTFNKSTGRGVINLKYSESKILYMNVRGDTIHISFKRSPIQADSITTTDIYWNSDMKKIVIKDGDDEVGGYFRD